MNNIDEIIGEIDKLIEIKAQRGLKAEGERKTSDVSYTSRNLYKSSFKGVRPWSEVSVIEMSDGPVISRMEHQVAKATLRPDGTYILHDECKVFLSAKRLGKIKNVDPKHLARDVKGPILIERHLTQNSRTCRFSGAIYFEIPFYLLRYFSEENSLSYRSEVGEEYQISYRSTVSFEDDSRVRAGFFPIIEVSNRGKLKINWPISETGQRTSKNKAHITGKPPQDYLK